MHKVRPYKCSWCDGAFVSSYGELAVSMQKRDILENTIREKIPFKCKINSYWRIKTIELQLYIGFFLGVLKISPSSRIGTGVIVERLPYQCNKYILENAESPNSRIGVMGFRIETWDDLLGKRTVR